MTAPPPFRVSVQFVEYTISQNKVRYHYVSFAPNTPMQQANLWRNHRGRNPVKYTSICSCISSPTDCDLPAHRANCQMNEAWNLRKKLIMAYNCSTLIMVARSSTARATLSQTSENRCPRNLPTRRGLVFNRTFASKCPIKRTGAEKPKICTIFPARSQTISVVVR